MSESRMEIDKWSKAKRWVNNEGHLHRVGAPAVEHEDGTVFWWHNGNLHREDGPAAEWKDGHKEWWYNDNRIDCTTQEEFERLIKLELFW